MIWSSSAIDATPGRAIVYLHGVDGPISKKRLVKHLTRGLEKIGYADDHAWEDEITVPVYVRQLKGGKAARRGTTDCKWSAAATTHLDREAYFERVAAVRPAALQFRRNPGHWRMSGTNVIVPSAFHGVRVTPTAFKGIAADGQAKQLLRAAARSRIYLQDKKTRRTIWSTVLGQWPTQPRVLVIAHSLGSVVLVDLLGRLPAGTGLDVITLGSPLDAPCFHSRTSRLRRRFPYARVNSWVNVRDPNDLVAWCGGLSHLLPGVIDVKVDTNGDHDVGKYLQRQPVAAMVARFLNDTAEEAPVAKPR